MLKGVFEVQNTSLDFKFDRSLYWSSSTLHILNLSSSTFILASSFTNLSCLRSLQPSDDTPGFRSSRYQPWTTHSAGRWARSTPPGPPSKVSVTVPSSPSATSFKMKRLIKYILLREARNGTHGTFSGQPLEFRLLAASHRQMQATFPCFGSSLQMPYFPRKSRWPANENSKSLRTSKKKN